MTKLGQKDFKLGQNDSDLGWNDSDLGRNDFDLGQNDLGWNDLFPFKHVNLETCSVACRLTTAVLTNYLEETFIPGSTFASKMKVLKPNRAALKLSISRHVADVAAD